jgi:hypothetical protein
MLTRLTLTLSTLAVLTAGTASAQTDSRPAPAVELLAGYAGFVDNATIDHWIFGGAARVYLTPRLAIGPEFVSMHGPDFDRDLFLTGNLTFDVLRPRAGRPRRVSPFLVAGGGFMQHSDRFGSLDFTSYEGSFTAGGGVRAWITDRVYALGEVRFGWELHTRVNGGLGVNLGR